MGQEDRLSTMGQEIPGLDGLFDDLLRRSADQRGGRKPNLREWVDLAEAWRVAHALREARGNRSAAARALGIGRRTLYSKMEKLGITPSWELGARPRPAAGNGSAALAEGAPSGAD